MLGTVTGVKKKNFSTVKILGAQHRTGKEDSSNTRKFTGLLLVVSERQAGASCRKVPPLPTGGKSTVIPPVRPWLNILVRLCLDGLPPFLLGLDIGLPPHPGGLYQLYWWVSVAWMLFSGWTLDALRQHWWWLSIPNCYHFVNVNPPPDGPQ